MRPHKEDFMAPLNMQLMDESHIRDIKTVRRHITLLSFCHSVILSFFHSGILHYFLRLSILLFQYLTAVADPTGGEVMDLEDMVYREG